jgi:hypothetical protein
MLIDIDICIQLLQFGYVIAVFSKNDILSHVITWKAHTLIILLLFLPVYDNLTIPQFKLKIVM